MSRIHALQSSTSSHKLLESVRALRPLLCEALRASGCETIDINEQDPTLHGESLQNENVQYLNSHVSDQHHDVNAQFVHVEELANLHSILSSDNHLQDLDVNAVYYGHMHEDLHAQHCNPWHVAPQSHNYANDGDAIQSFADVQHHVYRQNHDVHNHGHGKYFNTEYGHYGNEHHGDTLHHQHGDHRDAHHYEHGHENGYCANSMFVSPDNVPRTVDYSSELLGTQKDQEQIVQMSFWHSFPLPIESSVNNIDPYTPLSCTQYPQADNHVLDYQHIHANQNYCLQQHSPSETTTFVNTMLLEAPGSIISDTLLGAETTTKSNNINECIRAQDLSGHSMNNLKAHEVHTCHQARSTEVPPLPELCKHKEKLPKTMSKQFESSDESEGAANDVGVKLLSAKDKASTSTTNVLSERRRRKKWNEALYALRALVPIVSKMDKLSVVGDTLTYLQQLRDKVDNLENDISSLQTEKEELARSQEKLFTSTSQEIKSCKDSPKYKIVELDVHVVDMEQKTYHLCIRCEREDGVLLELTKALEALNFNMVNASIGATNEIQVLYTAVVKVDAAEVCPPNVLKEIILKSATMYGFHL